MVTAARRSPASVATEAEDAIAMLIADHKKVKDIFKQFEKLNDQKGSEQHKAELALQAGQELKIHMQIEEEIFYPAVRKALHDEDMIDEAVVEHAGARKLIEEIESMQPSEALYDAKVIVLGEQIEHHVKEEEAEMFPKVRKSKVDTLELGAEMMKRKLALMHAQGLSGPRETTAGAGRKK
ncbi:Hemerythrin HHE cation binding domain-containing protein [Solimonas aquatica]|uniref:Hemerythrin HHE cation binding domain-containing protein n=1 Tax=Solimonas aquatica TaxID=489703 RepID=A0A1H9KBP5_9GAMM|nr:hemerythrin domain-containing protein [Solimonas aquatica]SEQ96303.1 Hemerythrin HHE cation binding domain-containing protein [Solimonas aquatica]